MHRHHIVFRSQGGLDFNLNFAHLTYEEHEGNDGPHLNRERDLELKTDLQEELFELFKEDSYTIEEISRLLGKSKRYFEKHFKRVPMAAGRYKREEIIKKLMGGKFYFR
ncbi:HNH endonuclease [Anaerocolumna aminovalerica]|uniref:HNH endonuclease n=1 Tax=Anaerocolumna aminovalerica TaxID=1527 RepID=UPI001C0E9384|nr:HNH endonuclease [Anaerocolumna aminovalerica]MBU5331436.1 HNH endonuclease [Anaerocolumna aminovalerica]